MVVKERDKCKTSRGHLLYFLTYILTIAFRIFPNKMKGNFHILKRQISRGLNYVTPPPLLPALTLVTRAVTAVRVCLSLCQSDNYACMSVT